jgi:hypothetical protein
MGLLKSVPGSCSVPARSPGNRLHQDRFIRVVHFNAATDPPADAVQDRQSRSPTPIACPEMPPAHRAWTPPWEWLYPD